MNEHSIPEQIAYVCSGATYFRMWAHSISQNIEGDLCCHREEIAVSSAFPVTIFIKDLTFLLFSLISPARAQAGWGFSVGRPWVKSACRCVAQLLDLGRIKLRPP